MSADLPECFVLFVFIHFQKRLLRASALANITAVSKQETIAANGRSVLPVLCVIKHLDAAHSLYLLVELCLQGPTCSEHSLVAGLEVLGLS